MVIPCHVDIDAPVTAAKAGLEIPANTYIE